MSMHRTILENFRFLLIEVIRQVEDTESNLKAPSNDLIQKIHEQDDYIDNLKNLIEKNSFFMVLGEKGHHLDKSQIDHILAMHIAATNLERIADHAVNISKQTRHLHERLFVNYYDYRAFFAELLTALRQVEKAVVELDVGLAAGICKVEANLDSRFQKMFQQLLLQLKSGQDTENLLTTLFIFRYLERMGDELLNIGEAVISAHLGERMKIHHFKSLEDTISATVDAGIPLGELEYQAFNETRSGARIGRVDRRSGAPNARSVIFKDGKTQKIQEERESLERWNKLFPGLAPKVIDFQVEGHNASLLVEFVGGATLQSLILEQNDADYEAALERIIETVSLVWKSTMQDKPVSAGFVNQINKRTPDIFRHHPDLATSSHSIGAQSIPGFKELLNHAGKIEQHLKAPFSVLTHGDFNLDNIMFDERTGAVHFIDLHRSKQSDYVQDISVCLVSGFRLPVFDPEVRERILKVCNRLLRFAEEWSDEHGDQTYKQRLALGVARSLITSTRFVLKASFARTMFQRATYLLEKVVSIDPMKASEFNFPNEVLEY